MVRYKWEKINLVEENQYSGCQPIYNELENYLKTYFSGYRVINVNINNKTVNLRFFFADLAFHAKISKISK